VFTSKCAAQTAWLCDLWRLNCGAWTICKTVLKRLKHLRCGRWRKMGKMTWTAQVSNCEVLKRVMEDEWKRKWCSLSWCAMERHTGRQDDGKIHERKKETRTDEQCMLSGNFLRVNKEASGRQMSVKNTEVIEVIDLPEQQYRYTRREDELCAMFSVTSCTCCSSCWCCCSCSCSSSSCSSSSSSSSCCCSVTWWERANASVHGAVGVAGNSQLSSDTLCWHQQDLLRLIDCET